MKLCEDIKGCGVRLKVTSFGGEVRSADVNSAIELEGVSTIT